METFTILVGISGSGKTTWLRGQNLNNTLIVCPDDIRKELTGSISDQSKNDEVFKVAFDRVVDALNNNKSVIFDALNIDSYYRKSMLKTIQSRTNKPFKAMAKIFTPNPELSKERIKSDLLNNKDRSNVPPEIIDKQFSRYIKDIVNIEDDGYEIL